MVGRTVSFEVEKEDVIPGDVVLKVENLNVTSGLKHVCKDISFEVKSGEIVGIAGIDGNGQTELIQAITGLIPLNHGHVYLSNLDITKKTIREKYELGLAHIPEDRQKHGLILDFDLQSNLILQNFYMEKFQKKFFLKFDKITEHSENLIQEFDIRSEGGPRTIVRSMSGGNQQKAILAREIQKPHQLLIAVQPTRGLDVGAIEMIHNELLKERKKGNAILMVSLEIDEVIDISDRILVIYEGEIVANIDAKKADINELGLYMLGNKREERPNE
jgi:general nucleoside transport system ATP-binding protein